MEKEKKEHVSGRVNSSAVRNITSISQSLKWSFNQTLEYAMENLKFTDIVTKLKEEEFQKDKPY